jgi:hypothetical protein
MKDFVLPIIIVLAYWLIWRRSITPETPLKPGLCECKHERSCHELGKGECHAEYPPDEEWPHGARCACQIFILDRDDDDKDEPKTPSPEELERLYLK